MQVRERCAYNDEHWARKASFSAAAQKHLPGFFASQGAQAQPLLNYPTRPQQRYAYQTNQIYQSEEMMIQNHEAFGSGSALRERFNSNGGKWRLLPPPETLEEMFFQDLSSRDEHFGRKWRPAATGRVAPKMREEMRSTRKHKDYKVQQFADMVFEGMAASSMDERNGRKWRNMQRPAIIYQQSDAVNNTKSSRQRNFDYHTQQTEQPYYVYDEVNQSASEEEEEMVLMDAYEAAKLNGGVLILDYSNRK